MNYIVVTFTIEREGDQYVSRCLELGTASCGSTEEEALNNIVDATDVYFSTLEDLGECTQVLRAKGVKVCSSRSVSHRISCPANCEVHWGVFPLPPAACA